MVSLCVINPSENLQDKHSIVAFIRPRLASGGTMSLLSRAFSCPSLLPCSSFSPTMFPWGSPLTPSRLLDGYSAWARGTADSYENSAFNVEGHMLDLCAGHATTEGWYHHHSVPGCLQEQAMLAEGITPLEHSAQIGWSYVSGKCLGPHIRFCRLQDNRGDTKWKML